MIVLDASAAVELLLRTEEGEAVLELIEDPETVVHFPELLTIEVAQVLRRAVRQDSISVARVQEALSDLGDLDADRWRHDALTTRIFELRDNLTAYDATYVALAEALDADLVTFDHRLAAAPGHRATIRTLGTVDSD